MVLSADRRASRLEALTYERLRAAGAALSPSVVHLVRPSLSSVADLLFDERGDLRPLVNPFVDLNLERHLATPLRAESEVHVVAAIASG